MSEMKLTEEQEKAIWENAPDDAEWVAMNEQRIIQYYRDKPNWVAFIFQRPEKYSKNIDVSLGECCYKCDNYLGINIVNCGSEIICKEGHTEHPYDKCEFYSERNKTDQELPQKQDYLHTIKGTWKSDQYKPEYYLRAGEQYQPNRISDAYNLEGSKNQALKYLLRAGHKPIEGKSKTECEIVDLNKAKQQIIDRIAFLEGLKCGD